MYNKCERILVSLFLVRCLELGFKFESLKVKKKGSSAQSNRPQKWWQQWDGIFYIPQEIPSDKKPNINQTYLDWSL